MLPYQIFSKNSVQFFIFTNIVETHLCINAQFHIRPPPLSPYIIYTTVRIGRGPEGSTMYVLDTESTSVLFFNNALNLPKPIVLHSHVVAYDKSTYQEWKLLINYLQMAYNSSAKT